MIGFGELRKLALQWQVDLAEVERAYATDWLLKGLFDRVADTLILRGGTALRYAYFADYPFHDAPEFIALELPTYAMLKDALGVAMQASGLKFLLSAFAGSSAQVDYTGPLGRRSAAQPRITLLFIAGQPRDSVVRLPLLHRFSDACAATVVAQSLDEIAAERIAMLGAAPRTRDVFEAWFIVTHAHEQMDAQRIGALALAIAQAKQLALPNPSAPFNPSHRAILERGWNKANYQPAFDQVEQDLKQRLPSFIP